MNESIRLTRIREHIEKPFWWIPLTAKQREAVPSAIMGLSYEKIGDLMGLNKSSVSQHIRLAMVKINDDGKVRRIKNGDIYRPSQLPAIILGLIKEELTRD